MNTKPLDTKFDEFSAEEIEAMDDNEMFARSAYTSGDLGKMANGIAVEASQEIMNAIQMGRVLASAMGDVNDEGFDSTAAVAPMIGEIIIGSVLASMGVAREIERFAVENPEFPDTDPAEVFANMFAVMSGNGASPGESV